MPQSHLRRLRGTLVCDAQWGWKSGGLAGGWPGHGRCLDAGDCPVDTSEENNLELFSCDDHRRILYLSDTFQTPSSLLPGILWHLCMICNFFQVRRLKGHWRMTGGYPFRYRRVSGGCLEGTSFPFWELFRYLPVTWRLSSSAWPGCGLCLLQKSSNAPPVTGGLCDQSTDV